KALSLRIRSTLIVSTISPSPLTIAQGVSSTKRCLATERHPRHVPHQLLPQDDPAQRFAHAHAVFVRALAQQRLRHAPDAHLHVVRRGTAGREGGHQLFPRAARIASTLASRDSNSR